MTDALIISGAVYGAIAGSASALVVTGLLTWRAARWEARVTDELRDLRDRVTLIDCLTCSPSDANPVTAKINLAEAEVDAQQRREDERMGVYRAPPAIPGLDIEWPSTQPQQ